MKATANAVASTLLIIFACACAWPDCTARGVRALHGVSP